MLTGRASPYLHNGIMEPTEEECEGGYVFADGKVAPVGEGDPTHAPCSKA